MTTYFDNFWTECIAFVICVTAAISKSMPSPLKYAVLNHFNITQTILIDTLNNFHKKRDWYRAPNQKFDSFGPILIPVNSISQAANLSLITDDYFQKANISQSEYINIYTSVTSYPGTSYTLYNILKKHRAFRYKTGGFTILSTANLNFNFVYCDVPKFKQETPWHIDILLSPFQITFWYIELLFVVSAVLTLKLLAKDITFLETSFLVLRSMLPDNADATVKLKKIQFYYLWLLASLVLSSFRSSMSCVSLAPMRSPTDMPGWMMSACDT